MCSVSGVAFLYPMRQLKTELEDRVLRYDGVIEITPDKIAEYLMLGVHPSSLRVLGSVASVQQFNANVSAGEELLIAQDEPVHINLGWNLPKEYLHLDLETVISDKFEQICTRYSTEELEIAIQRIADELQEVQRRGLVKFMQTIIYIIDTFKQKNIVWGVGRGSSCASYLLFLLGLHVVDCVKMNVPMEEFYHD